MKARILAAVVPFAMLVACGRTEPPATSDTTTTSSGTEAAVPASATPSAAAQVMLAGPKSTGNAAKPASAIAGNLQLASAIGGVQVTGQITGLPPNTEHGFHIHQVGDCSAPDFKSVGEHFNPDGAMHGAPDSATHHLGDLPSVKADEQGTANVDALIAKATLADGGMHDLLGKAFVVHAKPDDYKTQPSGNSGDRIACGVIEKLP